MKKRILSLLMALVLAVGLLPMGAMAGDAMQESISITMTIYDQGVFARCKDNTPMMQKTVSFTDENGDGTPSLDEALSAAHALYAPNGASDYTSGDGDYGYSVSKLWGIETNAIGFYKNHTLTSAVNEETLSNGDYVVAFIYKDQTNWSDRYAYFTDDSIVTKVNEEFSVILHYDSWGTVSPQAIAPLGVFDSSGTYHVPDTLRGEKLFDTFYMPTVSTDSNGIAKMSFTETGTYLLTAQYDSSNYTDYYNNPPQYYLVPPICAVTVLSEEDYAAYIEAQENQTFVTQAKEQLTWDFIKRDNTSTSEVTTSLSLPGQIVVDSKNVAVTWTSSPANIIAANGTLTRPAEDVNVTLTAALTFGTASETVSFYLTVKGTVPPDVSALMETIAASYVDTSSEWVVMDMSAYANYNPDTTYTTSPSARQCYINSAIQSVAHSGANDTTLSKAVITLQSLGADPQSLYPVNSNTPINVIHGLNHADHSSSAWRAPYTLMAYNQGSYDTDQYEQDLIAQLLENQDENGSWDEFGTIDTTANMIAALSFYRSNPQVSTAIENAISYLAAQQQENGAFDDGYNGSNANSTAMVIIGLAAVGINPSTDSRFISDTGSSVLDGLLSFSLDNGFGHTNNTTFSPGATEQGFRALIAAAQVMSTGQSYNIYDFSATPVTPARETGNTASEKPTTPPTDPDDSITVTVTIKADTGYWLRSKSVTVSDGSTVCDAFVAALEGTGITQVGAENGYIRSITKNGVTLAEFTQGPNSGWLYKVNGELPNVGVTTCTLRAGDSIVLYYTEDWTKDPSAGGSSGPVTPAPSTPSATLTPEASANSKGEATVTVETSSIQDGLAQAEKAKADALIIAPAITGQAETITTQLLLQAAETIARDSNLALTVQTTSAAVTIPNEALNSIVTQSSGNKTIEVVVKTCAPDSLKDQAAGLDLKNASAVEVTVLSGGSPITTFGGQALTIDLPVDKTAYTAGSRYKVLVLSADGTTEPMTGQCIQENGGLVVQVSTPHLSTFLVTPQIVTDLPFPDTEGHWAADAIRFVYDQGLMTGTKEALFSPNNHLNRAMLATILYRMEGSPAVTGENPYTDVADGTWYTDAVLWAAQQGIVNGMGGGRFAPLDNITREQLAAMLLRYSDYKKYNTDARNDLASFTDADAISPWALKALRWANAQGLVTGRTATTLVPQGDTTRAETATILMRYLDTIAG